MKRKIRDKRVLIGVLILVIFISPIYFLSLKTSFYINSEREEGGSNTHTVTTSKQAGLSLSMIEIAFDSNVKVTIKKTSVLNFGIYSKIEKEVFFETIVDGKLQENTIKGKSIAWGFGNIIIRKNEFNKSLRKEINKLIRTQKN